MRFVLPILVLVLCACGGSQTPVNNAPAAPADPDDRPAPASNNSGPRANSAPREKPPVTPPESTEYRNVVRTDPEGWVRLNREGQAELLGHTKLKAAKPAEFTLVAAVTSHREPGGTEGEEHWAEWRRHAVGAFLYFVGKEVTTPQEAVQTSAEKIAAGVPEVTEEGGVAWTRLQGGEVLLAGLVNKHGTYLVVGIIQDTSNLEDHSLAIIRWAQSVKAE